MNITEFALQVELDDTLAEQLGKSVVDMLLLEPKKNGRYVTAWGDKTLMGVGKCVARLAKEVANATDQ
jgi:hypothetical protein